MFVFLDMYLHVRKVRVFENRVLRRIFGPKGDEMTRCWKNFIMRSFITCTFLEV
jgi:hypothetical protein